MNKKFILILLSIIASALIITSVQAVENIPVLKSELLAQTPNPARSGDTVDVRIKIENTGGDSAHQVLVEILPEFPFTLAPGQSAQQMIGELLNYPFEANYKMMKYTLLISKEAIDKEYDLKFRYSQDGGINWITDTYTVRVTSTEFAQIIHLDKTKINPGEETPLTFTINNIGKAPLTNLIFTWSEKNNVLLPVGTDNTRYIPYLGIGESLALGFTVVASPTTERGLYNINLKLTFDATNATSGGVQKSSIETNAGVLIGGSTEFDVALADSTGGKTSLSIANSGKNDASSVAVSIPNQAGFNVKGGSSVIIGNLNKGDFTLATFQLVANPAVKKEENRDLTISIAFTDSFGERHTLDKVISLKVTPTFGQDVAALQNAKKSGTSTTTWILIILILAGGGNYGFKLWKKKKSKK